jgi:hypothetical protein
VRLAAGYSRCPWTSRSVCGAGLSGMGSTSQRWPRHSNSKRHAVGLVLAMVLGITLLDLTSAGGIAVRHGSRRDNWRRYQDRTGFPGGIEKARCPRGLYGDSLTTWAAPVLHACNLNSRKWQQQRVAMRVHHLPPPEVMRHADGISADPRSHLTPSRNDRRSSPCSMLQRNPSRTSAGCRCRHRPRREHAVASGNQR